MNGYQSKESPAEEKPAEDISILYECDRRRCEDKCTFPICTHTSDIKHAQNFKLMNVGTQVQMWEEPRDKTANWIYEKEVKL